MQRISGTDAAHHSRYFPRSVFQLEQIETCSDANRVPEHFGKGFIQLGVIFQNDTPPPVRLDKSFQCLAVTQNASDLVPGQFTGARHQTGTIPLLNCQSGIEINTPDRVDHLTHQRKPFQRSFHQGPALHRLGQTYTQDQDLIQVTWLHSFLRYAEEPNWYHEKKPGEDPALHQIQ
ncbi:hypothetical protein [Guyparkeria sp. SB14A]|uniref:hypothetical protein n=1 Tax=Guyparkeria sp. SB14A TaxID=2571147 RepID=UPI001FFC88E6|nr:hypothetical protein [Guyparkeria sp. SB14A]